VARKEGRIVADDIKKNVAPQNAVVFWSFSLLIVDVDSI
jgi:hypothetical protein